MGDARSSAPATSRALWFVAPRRVELRDEPLPPLGEGDVLVKALASAVSQGTEMLLYRGEGPEIFDPSLGGATSPPDTYPRRYGYAWVGEIVSGPEDYVGQRVFSLAPHGEHHVLPFVATRFLGDDVPPTRAVLAANLETAVTCTWDAELGLGDSVVVLGGGVVGLLTAWLVERSGAFVTLVEKSALRREAARVLLSERAAILASPRPDGEADVVIEATGRPEALDAALAWCRPEGRVVVASFYGNRRAPVDLGDAFHRRRLTIRSSQVSSLPPRQRARWDHDRRWFLVSDLLHEPRLDALLGEPVPFDRAADLYASLDTDDDLPPAHVFVYR